MGTLAPLTSNPHGSSAGVSDGAAEAQIGGYSVIKADDLDAAAGLVKSHPFVRRGGSLQVCEAVAP